MICQLHKVTVGGGYERGVFPPVLPIRSKNLALLECL